MVDRVKVIINPKGGRLKKQAKVTAVEQALQQVGLNYSLQVPDHPAHCLALTRETIREGWPVVVAAGGDGLINQVLNGLMQAAGENEAGILGIIPLGTANDLADMLGLPQDIEGACERIAAARTRLIDVGQVNDRYFVNNSAVGLEPMVTLQHEQMRKVKGNLRYVLAALKTIIRAKPWFVRLTWGESLYDGPVTLVSVGNSRRTGGSFYLTPKAELDDGLLDFIFDTGVSRWQMLQLLPQTLKGTHIHHPRVTYLRTPSLSITCSRPTPVQADGEVFNRSAKEIHYRIIPHKLRVII